MTDIQHDSTTVDQDAGSSATRTPNSKPAASIRVLIVDDDPEFADLTATYLERENPAIEPTTVTTAEEALTLLEQPDEFDCIISDYEMPGKDGIELLETVQDRQLDIPFILFTGRGSEDIASQAISAGVTDYLQKKGGTEQYERLANRILHASAAKQAKRTARDTESYLKALVQNVSDVIVTIDETSTVQFVSEACESVFGYSPDEVEGKSLTMLMPERYRDKHSQAISRYLTDQTPRFDWRDVEFEGLHRNGQEIPLSISFGEFTRDGQQYFVGVIRDVTERKVRERNLEEAQSFTEKALDALDDVFFVFEPDGSFLRWNSRIHDVTGYTDAEIREMQPVDFFIEDHRSRVAAAIDECLETGSALTEATVLTKDGEQIPYEFSARTLTDNSGELIGVAGIGREINS